MSFDQKDDWMAGGRTDMEPDKEADRESDWEPDRDRDNFSDRINGVRPQTMDRASKYLAYKPRTRADLVRHLRERGCDEEEACLCADLLEEYHLLDDLDYSRMYMESMIRRGRGMARICRDLRAKGVDANTIEDARADLDTEGLPGEDQVALEAALAAVADQDLLHMDYREREKVKGRIARRLAGRGFSTDTIFTAVRRAFQQREADQREEED